MQEKTSNKVRLCIEKIITEIDRHFSNTEHKNLQEALAAYKKVAELMLKLMMLEGNLTKVKSTNPEEMIPPDDIAIIDAFLLKHGQKKLSSSKKRTASTKKKVSL